MLGRNLREHPARRTQRHRAVAESWDAVEPGVSTSYSPECGAGAGQLLSLLPAIA
jgi:hypothetical protein